ncbi:DUF4170 domain-containing protein [Bartonella sp. DGB1]|uniref:DUF4170 domain-containing protein n=1 Tax=Bartonella sp. DGB1 TaxID=3239807 RepID=UPI003526BC8F
MSKMQELYLVFGGELESLNKGNFRNVEQLELVGIYPTREAALSEWKAKSQATVDNAHQKYCVVALHKAFVNTD